MGWGVWLLAFAAWTGCWYFALMVVARLATRAVRGERLPWSWAALVAFALTPLAGFCAGLLFFGAMYLPALTSTRGRGVSGSRIETSINVVLVVSLVVFLGGATAIYRGIRAKGWREAALLAVASASALAVLGVEFWAVMYAVRRVLGLP